MSNNGKKRLSREKREREIRETTPERDPKKFRDVRDSDTDEPEDGAVAEAELLDPVAEARKALEMFEEVSGETIVHIIPKTDSSIKVDVGDRYGNVVDSGQISRSHKNGNKNGTKMSSKEERRKAQARQKEEKARQRKRIEDGEAKRREFRPKIAGLQDSNWLL